MTKIIIILTCLAFLSPAYAKEGNKGKKFKNVPKGIEKKIKRGKALPPGWQKKLTKGQPLDKEVYDNAVPVTKEEKEKLPQSPAGAKLLKIENKIVSVMGATRTILDVFEVGEKDK